MNNPFAYEALSEEEARCPEQYFSVSADYNQWMSIVVEGSILESQRQGGPFDEAYFRKVNAVYGQFVGIYAMMPSIIYEHKMYDMVDVEVADEEGLRQMWQKAADNNNQIILYTIKPLFRVEEGVSMRTGTSSPKIDGFVVSLSYA